MLDLVRDRILPSKPAQLVIQTVAKWQQDKCAVMGAALSYYALFAVFPVLLIVFSLMGQLVGPDTDIFEQIQVMVASALPSEGQDLVQGTLITLNRSSVGAGIIGSALLLYTGSNVFSILTQAIDVIWMVNSSPPEPPSLKQAISMFATNKMIGFMLVFGLAFMLVFLMTSNIFINGVVNTVEGFEETFGWINLSPFQVAESLQAGITFLILAIATLILLKILPSARVARTDVWPGALLTAFLLLGLQQVVSSSVVKIGSRYASYGVIGGLMILMLWIYFTCQIFFIGCEFSYVFAQLFGSHRHYPKNEATRPRTFV